MPSPFLIVQLSDPHIGARWSEGDPVATLAAAVDSVRALRPHPDVVLVTGDLADGGADVEYERTRELLAALPAPAYVLPGNHDDRAALRRHFDLPGVDAEPVCYSVDLGSLQLVVLDSTTPGEDPGALDDERLAWLEQVLSASPEQPTLIAMHHPPLRTGVPGWDAIGLDDADRRLLADLIGRHGQVRRIVAGHLHRTIAGELMGRSVLAVPSTYVQARLDFGSRNFELAAEPAGFAVHAVLDGEVTSHIQPVV
jgi:3',5'-cyclic AMP phosphodiesterase CpdA